MTYKKEYPQGIWCLDRENENMAVKIVNDTKTIRVPVTTEILEEIKRQLEADKMLTAFTQLNVNDTNIIGYLNLMLSDYINFLTPETKNTLINKMKEIELSPQLDEQNISHIQNLKNQLATNNIEEYYNALDNFQAYNIPLFENALANNETQGRSH